MEPRDVAGMFITHEHSDHIRSMCLRTPAPQRFEFPVFASPGFWKWYDGRLARYIDPELRRVLVPGQSVQVSGMTVQAFSKPHDAADPLGFVVESQGERAGFVMDLGHVPERLETILRGLDHLVFESNHDVEMERNSGRPWFLIRKVLGDLGHLSNEQASTSLVNIVTAGTRQVILAHLSVECNTPEMARDAVLSALAAAGKRPAIHTAPPGDLAVYR
jgi:phosphoribosyl 1,2-cyclic phosphodiesterase